MSKLEWKHKCLVFVIFTILFLSLLSMRYQVPHSLVSLLDGSCDLNSNCMESTELTDHIRSVIVKPSGTKPILEKPDEVRNQKGQTGQVDTILKHFKNKENGFFIEAGAWDGEQLSNTIYLETMLGWTGLLVEPNKGAFNILTSKHRNAHCINSCLSTKRHSQQVEFDTADVFGSIVDGSARIGQVPKLFHKEIAREVVITQCFPLYSILLAIGQTRVDFFSLDIEGAEMDVLKTIPFDKIDIEIFLIETNKSNVTAMNSLLSSHGYKMTPLPPYDHLFIKSRVG